MAQPSFQQPPTPNQPTGPQPQEPAAPEVYTMPTQYMTGQKPPSGGKSDMSGSASGGKKSGGGKSGGSKKILLIIIFIVVGLAILGGGGYYLMTYVLAPSQPAATTNQPVIANLNTAPANINSNDNANLNSNENENTNTNENSNDNANLNSNENENTNTSSDTNVSRPTSVNSTTDSDNDGLTDVEEQLYGTKINQPDTDEDGYLDGDEVRNGFNPTGAGKILKSDKVKLFENSEFGYSINYTIAWIAEALNVEDAREVLFTSDTGEFMEVIVQDNPSGQTVEAWYKSQFPEYTLEQLETFKVNDDTAVKSADGFTVYFANDNYIYAVTYKYGTKKEVNFLTTFEMMYKSFLHKIVDTVKGQKSNTNENENKSGN